MVYKTVIQDGPEWLPKAVVCKVWDKDDKRDVYTKEVIGRANNGIYIDLDGIGWQHAEPYEAWEQKEGEWVIAWDDGCYEVKIVGQCGCVKPCPSGYHIPNYGYFDHIARLKNPDGSMVYLDCTIDELKQRTEWK